MTTLMTVGNSEGSRRCDAKCYDAKEPDCDCVCGGMNHGKGIVEAEKNTSMHAQVLLEKFGYEVKINKKDKQLELFQKT